MSNILFKRPRGTDWHFKWGDEHSNILQAGVAPGFETRLSLGPDPIRTLELAYTILKAGSMGRTRDQLIGFFNLRHGNLESFLVDLGALTSNPADSSIIGQVLDYDVNGYAPIQRTHYVSEDENWQENIYELAGVNGNPGSPPVLKLNGSPLTAGTDYVFEAPGYSISGETFPGLMVIIIHALTDGDVVTADFSWYYRVRFQQASQEFEMFHRMLWRAQQIRVVQTRV